MKMSDEEKKKRRDGYKNGRGGTKLVIALHGSIADTVIEQAKLSGTKVEQWVAELIDVFRVNHRSNKFTGDPNRHDSRDTPNMEIYHEY